MSASGQPRRSATSVIIRIALTFLGLLSLVQASATAATAHARVILCDKPIAEAIKRHLDGGALPLESFEATYERLKEGKQLEELFRFSGEEPNEAARFKFQSPGGGTGDPSEKWEALIELETTQSPAALRGMLWGAEVTAPKDRKSGVSPFYRSNSLTLITPNHWNVTAEHCIGEQVLLSMVHLVPQTVGSFSPPLVSVDGYLLAMSASGAEAFVKKTAADLAKEADTLKASKKSGNAFRFRIQPGQIASHEKGDPEAPRYRVDSLSDTEATKIEILTSISPDGTLVDCLAVAGLVTQSGSDSPATFTIPVAETFPTGSWVAFPASKKPGGKSRDGAVLLLKIGYRPDPTATLQPQAPDKPLPAAGTVTRAYHAHPGALRILAGGNDPAARLRDQPLAREIFQRAGVPAGSWTISWGGSNHLLVSGSPQVHEQVLKILGKLRWEGPVLKSEVR